MIIGLFKDSAFASSSRSSGKNTSRRSASTTENDSDNDIVEVAPHPRPELIGWAYVGSHNFTPSAWGNLSGSAFNPIMNVSFCADSSGSIAFDMGIRQIANFELGIVLPLKSEKELEDVVCWQRPARKYTSADEPWVRHCFRALFSLTDDQLQFTDTKRVVVL